MLIQKENESSARRVRPNDLGGMESFLGFVGQVDRETGFLADLRPSSGYLTLLYGEGRILKPAQCAIFRRLRNAEQQVWVLDGANAFDPFLITQAARDAGFPPESWLRRVRVSRSFTAHQMLSLMRHLSQMKSKPAGFDCLFLGPVTSFYDENIPRYEIRALFHLFQQELETLYDQGCRLWLICPQPALENGRRFVRALIARADRVFCCREESKGPAEAHHQPLKLRRGGGNTTSPERERGGKGEA
jgi:hypothetical protein